MRNDARGQLVIDFTQNWRNIDPITSEIAGREIEACGKAERDRGIILSCLRRHNGSTNKELAEYLHGVLTYAEIHKRMRELQDQELIKKNQKIRRERCCTWWIL